MARASQRGATRKPVRKERQPVAWQKWLRYSTMVSMVIAVIAGTVYLSQDDTLPILHVTVEGDFVYANKEELVKAVTPYVKGSFINVDVASIRDAGEALPWVKQIQVRRIWPDSLHLIVDEQAAVARWHDDALVNKHGEVFQPPRNTFPTELVVLEGLKGSSQVMTKRLFVIQKQMSTLGLNVKKVTMDQRRAWTIDLDNEMQVVLGRADSEQRLQRFVKVFKAGLQRFQTNITAVDMRYTNGMSVIWKYGHKPDFNGTV